MPELRNNKVSFIHGISRLAGTVPSTRQVYYRMRILDQVRIWAVLASHGKTTERIPTLQVIFSGSHASNKRNCSCWALLVLSRTWLWVPAERLLITNPLPVRFPLIVDAISRARQASCNEQQPTRLLLERLACTLLHVASHTRTLVALHKKSKLSPCAYSSTGDSFQACCHSSIVDLATMDCRSPHCPCALYIGTEVVTSVIHTKHFGFFPIVLRMCTTSSAMDAVVSFAASLEAPDPTNGGQSCDETSPREWGPSMHRTRNAANGGRTICNETLCDRASCIHTMFAACLGARPPV